MANTADAGMLMQSIREEPKAPVDFFVRWKAHVPRSKRMASYQQQGLRLVWRSSLVEGLERVVPVQRALTPHSLQSFVSDRDVIYAEPNYRIRRTLPRIRGFRGESSENPSPYKPNDPMLPRQWALTANAGINPMGAWNVTHGSRSIKVAVIDTGVDPRHSDLADGRVAAGFDFIDETPSVRDHHGHGTHVAGVIGAATNNAVGIAGINPEVTIVPIRAIPTDGDETDDDVIAAFEFAVRAGARVANCSFGKRQQSQAVADTIAAAGQHGLLAVVSSGNDGVDINRSPVYPAAFHTANMIVVAAHSESGNLAMFSNYGLRLVDVSAPGTNILSTVLNDGYDSWSGTSMASPQVSGIAALILSAKPNMDVMTLKQVLLDSAIRDPRLRTRIETGARVNASTAMQMALGLR